MRLRSKSVVTNTRPRRSKSEPSDLKGNWENSFNMSELFPNFYNLKTFQAKLKKLEKEEKNSNDEMSSVISYLYIKYFFSYSFLNLQKPNQTITIPNFISQGNFSSQKTNTSSSFEEEVCYDSNQSSSIKYASTKFLIDSIIYVPPTEFQQCNFSF